MPNGPKYLVKFMSDVKINDGFWQVQVRAKTIPKIGALSLKLDRISPATAASFEAVQKCKMHFVFNSYRRYCLWLF